jgi:hypothetical protein
MSNPLDELMKQAQKLQEKMGKNAEEQQQKRFVGEAGAGLVKVTINGQRQALRVDIDDSVLKEEKPVLEDLLLAAINNALNKAEESSSFSISDIASQLNLKDFLNPLKK